MLLFFGANMRNYFYTIISILFLTLSLNIYASHTCAKKFNNYTQFFTLENKNSIKIKSLSACGNSFNTSTRLTDSVITITKSNKVLAKFYTRNATVFHKDHRIFTADVLPLTKLPNGLKKRMFWNIDLIKSVIRAPRGIYYSLN